MNKIKEYLKYNIKSILKVLIIYITIILLFTVPTNYEIYSPGGLIDISKRININNDFKLEGSFNLTYVSGKKGIIPFVLLSYIIPSWDLKSIDEHRIENESYAQMEAREELYLKSGVQNSIIYAFDEANIDIELLNPKLVVLYVLEEAESEFEVKDEIKKIGNKEITSYEDFVEEISKYEENDDVEITVLRNDKLVVTTSKIKNISDNKKLGIMVLSLYDIESDPSVEFMYKKAETGSSGGLMNALYIYSVITKTDLTKGDKIAGTGTMEADGTIGEIGGLKYKIKGAVNNNATVFITGSANIEEAKEIIKENNYDIELIEAESFSDIINKLKNR